MNLRAQKFKTNLVEGVHKKAGKNVENDLENYHSRKGIFWKSLPLIISELGESLALLTGVLFMAFEGELHLAAIGMIDAFLLLCLVYGFALNDGYQNFYARQAALKNGEGPMAAVLKDSIFYFMRRLGLFALTGAFAIAGIYLMFPNPVFLVFIKALPLLFVLVLVYSIGLALHAFLAGNGHFKTVGALALLGIGMNAFLLYYFLYLNSWSISPTNTVVLAAICSETIWVLGLLYFAGKKGVFKQKEVLRQRKMIASIIRRSSIFPGLSNAAFQLATLSFFVYFSDCCAEDEVATMSVLFSFWTVLMSPVNGICESAINGFSGLHASGVNLQERIMKLRIFHVAIAVSALIAVILLFGGELIPKNAMLDWPLMLVFALLLMMAIRNRIGFVAMIVKLRIAVFLRLKLTFIVVAALCFVLFLQWFEAEVLIILLSLLAAQLVVARKMSY